MSENSDYHGSILYLQHINRKTMKNRFKFIAIFGLAFTLASCTGTSTENESGDQPKSEMNDQRNSVAMSSLGLQLNDGKKWQINPEAAKGIDKMDQIIKEYNERKPSRDTYTELSKRLMEQFDYTLSNAKMEGPAREQLHYYMKPMKDYFQDLNSDDLSVAENAVMKFKQHLAEFPNYFKW